MILALDAFPLRISKLESAIHNGIAFGHFFVPCVYACRTCSARFSPARCSSCPSCIQSFQNVGNFSMPSSRSLRSAFSSPASRSTSADFIQTRAQSAKRSRALASNMRARSISPFSNSNLKAASQISSESGLASKADCKISRARVTSPLSQRSFAPMSHKISALGQKVTALRKTASTESGVPNRFSNIAAFIHKPFLCENPESSACA
mmetsp:Transcript_3278/g.12663  ORF Transcript_3278/g.12663 Transcript_3278/m.12663 type:complete len:207 (+) Transcript_3278:590-1210(+)